MGPIFAESLKVIFHLVSFVVRVKISDVGANKSSARYVAKGSDAPPSFLSLENLKNSVMCCLMTSSQKQDYRVGHQRRHANFKISLPT